MPILTPDVDLGPFGKRLPVLPLRDVVFFPYVAMPLIVGRRASLAAVDAAMDGPGGHYLLVVTQRNPKDGMAWYLLSQAYAREGDYADGITSAEQAVKFTPNNAEAHFWLAESLRQKHECVRSENSTTSTCRFPTSTAASAASSTIM